MQKVIVKIINNHFHDNDYLYSYEDNSTFDFHELVKMLNPAIPDIDFVDWNNVVFEFNNQDINGLDWLEDY